MNDLYVAKLGRRYIGYGGCACFFYLLIISFCLVLCGISEIVVKQIAMLHRGDPNLEAVVFGKPRVKRLYGDVDESLQFTWKEVIMNDLNVDKHGFFYLLIISFCFCGV
eukprot:68887_1